uniref:Protein sleepless n=1 Tax=Panagrellus redivivus TaxID=6233 RepID=A0A7E4VLW7_PANRE
MEVRRYLLLGALLLNAILPASAFKCFRNRGSNFILNENPHRLLCNFCTWEYHKGKESGDVYIAGCVSDVNVFQPTGVNNAPIALGTCYETGPNDRYFFCATDQCNKKDVCKGDASAVLVEAWKLMAVVGVAWFMRG